MIEYHIKLSLNWDYETTLNTIIFVQAIHLCVGQETPLQYTLDSTSYFTIARKDTLKGHHDYLKSELDTFKLVRRHYNQYDETRGLKGIGQAKEELGYTKRDQLILTGQYNSGLRTGTWVIYNEVANLEPGQCVQYYPEYYVRYYQDSILVENREGSTFRFSDTSALRGTIHPKNLRSLNFSCPEGECEFLIQDSTTVKFGHEIYLRQELAKIEQTLRI